MASTMRRAAAFTALWKALVSQGGPSLGKRLAATPKMIWYTLTGRYDGGARIMLMLGGMIYVASPIDLLPEALLLVPGLLDDAFVIAWLAGALISETDRFLKWDHVRTGGVVIDGDLA